MSDSKVSEVSLRALFGTASQFCEVVVLKSMSQVPPSCTHPSPPWRQPRGKWMVSLVNSHTNSHHEQVASVEDWLKICPQVDPMVVVDGLIKTRRGTRFGILRPFLKHLSLFFSESRSIGKATLLGIGIIPQDNAPLAIGIIPLKATEDMIWPPLSFMCHIRSAAVLGYLAYNKTPTLLGPP